jgi:pilus assembly protein CpaF
VASAQSIVEGEVRELVRRRQLDPVLEPEATRRLVDEVLSDYLDRAAMSVLPPLGDAEAAARTVFDQVAGFGPLQQYFDDRAVEEIWINEPGRVFIARHGRSELTTVILTSDEVADLVERMLRLSGRRLDLSAPFVDAQLPDGSELRYSHVTHNASARVALRPPVPRCERREPIPRRHDRRPAHTVRPERLARGRASR